LCCSHISPSRGFVENPVCAEKCSLRVKLLGETIEPESCVIVAGDSEGEELVSLVLKQASDLLSSSNSAYKLFILFSKCKKLRIHIGLY
jgi:hypothetical protein